MASKFKRDGSNVWIIKYKDVDGSWKSKSTGTTSTRDAETIRKNYDAIELNNRHKMLIKKIDADLKEQLKIFRDNEIPRSNTGRPKSKKSIQRYKAIIDNLITFLDKDNLKNYEDIDHECIRKFFDQLINEDQRSASTISKHRQIFINFWNWSIQKGFCRENPVLGIKNPKRKKKIPRFFNEEELQKIFNSAKDPYKNIFKFLYLTGLRIGELGNLEWQDYIEHNKEILLRVIEGNKTKREEVVPLNADAIAIIEDQKKLKAELNTADSNRFVFVNSHGLKLDDANIYRHLKVVLKNEKIEGASPHTFRHTCASHLVIKGISLYIVRDILRHASIRETEIYAHLSKEATRSAIEQLSVHNTTSQHQKA